MQRPSVEEQNHKLFRLITPTIFISNVFSEFVQGLGKAPPEIDNSSCRKLLRRSVATLCAHSGYDGKRFEMCINSLLLCEKDPIYIVEVKNKPKNKILFVKLPSYLVVYFSYSLHFRLYWIGFRDFNRQLPWISSSDDQADETSCGRRS